MSAPVLQMRGIGKRFGATVALDGVSLDTCAGEVHALVGENGAGKSTLMKILAGALRPDAGEMFYRGHAYRPRGPQEARRAGVGMIYQELSLCAHLSVEENITLGMEPRKGLWLDRRQRRARARSALIELGHEGLDPAAPVSRLSMSERQVVEIARALALGCRVLVFDEPTSSLTGQDALRLFALIERLKARGLAMVYISHFLEEIEQLADRVSVLRDGRTVASAPLGEWEPGGIVRAMVGRETGELYPRGERTPGEVVVEVKDLRGVDKPRGASLTLRRGEVVGLCGLVGAGRTEFLRALFGLDAVRAGEVRTGVYKGPATPGGRWAQDVGFVSEDRGGEGLFLDRSLADNLTMTRLCGFGPGGTVLAARQESAAREWIGALGIRCGGPAQAVGALSGGNQQKVAFARLLQHGCDILFLDEPARGIDVGAKKTLYEWIDRVVRDAERPRAVLLASSYLPELLGVCDRVAVMHRGRLSAAKPVEEWTPEKLMLVATGKEPLREEGAS